MTIKSAQRIVRQLGQRLSIEQNPRSPLVVRDPAARNEIVFAGDKPSAAVAGAAYYVYYGHGGDARDSDRWRFAARWISRLGDVPNPDARGRRRRRRAP